MTWSGVLPEPPEDPFEHAIYNLEYTLGLGPFRFVPHMSGDATARALAFLAYSNLLLIKEQRQTS